MFQFPALASIEDGCHSFRMTGCPIRKSLDQGLFAPTQSLSQLITSFIASESQGIRHAPLLTFFQTDFFMVGMGIVVLLRRYQLIQWRVCGLIYTFSSLLKFTFCTSCQRSFLCFQRWWRITDSNRWPPACKAGALASWANPPKIMKNKEGGIVFIHTIRVPFCFFEVVPGRVELPTSTLSV